jgi:tetratricopeptide (TPR) repeat protein
MRPIAAALLLCTALATTAYDAPGMRDAMRSVFASMRVLLERSATTEDAAAPANQRAMLEAAQEIADQAGLVAEHAPRDEVSFLASSLDRYATWIRRSIEWGRTESTQRLVRDAVDVCIACHTRLPSRRDSPVANDFLESEHMRALPARERAQLAVATRRFEDALDTLEQLLAEDIGGEAFEDTARRYLVVAVRVKRDPGRAKRTLAVLSGRGGLEPARIARLETWIGALQRLELSPPPDGDLDVARAMVRQAEARRMARLGDPLVDYIAASRVLYEFLESDAGTVEEGAEAYYLLGLSQYRIEEDAWLPQAELYLEKAIRTAPGSEHARRALALLRERITLSFPAQGGGVPDDVTHHLEMLQEMVEGG